MHECVSGAGFAVCAPRLPPALIVAVVPAQAQILRKDGVLPALDRRSEPFGLSVGCSASWADVDSLARI